MEKSKKIAKLILNEVRLSFQSINNLSKFNNLKGLCISACKSYYIFIIIIHIYQQ